MRTFVSMIRGINVGGKNMMSMEKLRALYASLGFENPRTYVQSGNVVFGSTTKNSELVSVINKKIKQVMNIDLPVFVRSRAEISKIVANAPYSQKDWPKIHVTFLSEEPKDFSNEAIDKFVGNGDKYKLIGSEIYLLLPNGYGRTKLTNNLFEKKLHLTATTRNWNTVNALHKMASQE